MDGFKGQGVIAYLSEEGGQVWVGVEGVLEQPLLEGRDLGDHLQEVRRSEDLWIRRSED